MLHCIIVRIAIEVAKALADFIRDPLKQQVYNFRPTEVKTFIKKIPTPYHFLQEPGRQCSNKCVIQTQADTIRAVFTRFLFFTATEPAGKARAHLVSEVGVS